LDNYVKDASAKFITGEASFDRWGEYIATLQQLGLDEVNAIYQAAYDRQFSGK